MDSPAHEFYHDLYAVYGLHLQADGDRIRVWPASKITPAIRAGIRLHKAELLEILRLPIFEGLPRASCQACGSRDLWLGARGLTWLCVSCAPPPSPEEVRIRHKDQGGSDLTMEFTIPVRNTVDDTATKL